MWTPGMHRSVWLLVYYVDAWYALVYLVTCLLCGRLVCTGLSGYVFIMWTPGMHWSIWLRVCYVDAWYALVYLVKLPNARTRQHIQTDRCIPGVHIINKQPDRPVHTRQPHNRHITTYNAVLSTIAFDWHVTHRARKSSLKMTHTCLNM
jgi:hypothetical protein